MFKFEHPDHLWLLTAIPLLVLLWAAWWWWRRRALARLGDTTYVLPPISGRRFLLKNMLLAFALTLLAIAWANPQLGAKKQAATQKSSDIFIALDISQSMLCQDVAPSRLELSKIFIQKLVKRLEGERVGLIFFAGSAFLQMPLSSDYAFIFQSVQSASPDMLTEQGTNIAAAIEIAQKSFDPEPGGRMLILISDGETHEEGALDKADEAFDNGTVVYAVGAGTAFGGPIPAGGMGEGEYKRDEKNEIVHSRLDEAALGKIALSGGGQSYNIAQGDAAISALKRAVDGLQKRDIEVRSFAEYESWYQWFLLPGLLLLALEFFVSFKRIRAELVSKQAILIGFVLLSTQMLSAQSVHKSLRQGDQQYLRDNFKEAEKEYRTAADLEYFNPKALYNLGNALYQQGKWEDAADRFGQAAKYSANKTDAANALYNLGNAFLKQRKFKEAIESYENSLRLRPADSETKTNLQLAKKKFKQEEEQKQQQQQQQKNESQENNQDQSQSQPPQNQQEQQLPPQNENQSQQPQSGQSQQPPPPQDQSQTGKLKKEDAQRLLETAIGPEDQRNARKYRSAQQKNKPNSSKKDW